MRAGRLGSFVSARILWLSAWLIRYARLAGLAALFIFDEPESRTCVHSLFPHLGQPPCWYAERRNVKRTDL